MVTEDEAKQHNIVNSVIKELHLMDMAQTPPEMARKIHSIIRDVSGVKDAYRQIKDDSTEFALKLIPKLEEEIKNSLNSFETIVRLVIAGNIIDFGADIHFKLDTALERIKEALTAPLDIDSLGVMKNAMEKAKNILYLADNCGEAVFDRFLIEPFKGKITLAVRGFPILNDITPREVAMSGLSGLVKVIDTGDATPGVVLKYAGPEFVKAFHAADLIISKGQGNFETLNDTDKPIIFLFRVKCNVISRLFDNIAKGSLRIIPRNLL
jgi:uncharacterized protein with ATP-grasp and redox domains